MDNNSVYSPSSEAAPSNVGQFHVENTTVKDNLEKIDLNSENADVFSAVTQLKQHLCDDEDDDDPAENADVMNALQTILNASSGKSIDIHINQNLMTKILNIFTDISRNEEKIERGYI